MSGQMISKIESGLSSPSIETINKIAALLNVPAGSLLEDYSEESFSYKLICAIEESFNAKSDDSPACDIFQVLSDDLEINYEDFDNYLLKKTICTKDYNGSYIYTQIINDNLDKTKDLPIDHIRKLLTYYSQLDNYKFRKLCSDVFYDNIPVTSEIKNIINKFVENSSNTLTKGIEHYNEFPTDSLNEEHKNSNISEYYRYLEIRIRELAVNSNMDINKDTTNEIIKNIDSLIEFELHKLKTKVNSSNEN